jgi:hypothetical protein
MAEQVEDQAGARARAREEKKELRTDVILRASDLIALVLFIGGILFNVLYFPNLVHRTYFSENALLPTGAITRYGEADAALAQEMLQTFRTCQATAPSARSSRSDAADTGPVSIIMSTAKDLGLEVETHHFDLHLPSKATQPESALPWASSPPPDTVVQGTNVVALLRAPRGEGKEAMVLQAEYTDADADAYHALEGDGSVSVLLSLMHALRRAPWLSKDVLFLASPKSARGHAAVSAWLLDYHNCTSPMLRSGEIWAALALDVPDHGELNSIAIAFEGDQGNYPNLDLVNVAARSVRASGFHAVIPLDFAKMMRHKAARRWPHTDAGGGRSLRDALVSQARKSNGMWGRLFTWIEDGIDSLGDSLGVSHRRLSRSLRSSLVSQALGQPSGNHAAFKAFKVEALSLIANPERSSHLWEGGGRGEVEMLDLVRYGQAVEHILHSVSNLLERFHQSFFMWVLLDEAHFFPPEKYLATAGVLLAPPLLRAIALWIASSRREDWRLHELGLVLLAFSSGLVLALAREYGARGGAGGVGGGGGVDQVLLLVSMGLVVGCSLCVVRGLCGGAGLDERNAKRTNDEDPRAPAGGSTGRWCFIFSQGLVAELLVLATLCLTNFAFGYLVLLTTVPPLLLGFGPRPRLYHSLSLAALTASFTCASVAISRQNPTVGGSGVPGGGRCLSILHSLVLLPAMVLLVLRLAAAR